jgi:alkylation response protein AidB-like acyl-CoA dehydrogenase
MDFGLTEEQEMLQETVGAWVDNECPPARLRELFDAGAGHDPALWRGISEMGLAGLVVPEEFGGAGMEVLDLALVSEKMGAGAVPGPFLGHSLACLALVLGGSEEQKKSWLPKLASGEIVGTFAAAEENSRWEPTDWSVEEKDARLNGVKLFVPHADHADVIVVGCSRGRLALVHRGADGLRIENMDGIDRSRPIFEAVMDDVSADVLPAGQRVSGRVRDAALVMLAADSFGAAWNLVQITCEYSKTRQQFGTPIAQFQAVKHQIAALATDIEPTRGLYWHAAHAFDHLPDESERLAALAKAHISDRAMVAARQAVELWGGLGFTWECDVQLWFKRVMFDRASFGTPEHLRERVALLGGW